MKTGITQTDDHGLRTVEGDGSPARTRFSDPVALRNTYDTLTRDDALEATRRAKLRNLYDGCFPYPPELLKKCGLKNLTNVNWLGLKGLIDNRADTILKLSCDTANLIELQPKARELAGPDAQRIARVEAEEFSTLLRETGDVIPALSMMNTEADLYGLGPVTWLTDEDYKPVALERGQVRFVSDGPVQSSRHDLFMFESTLQASYLFFLLDHEDIAAEEGWDVQGIREWLVRAFRDDVESRLSLIRQNRFEEEHQFRRLKVLHAYVREMGYPRGITHIITPAADACEPEKTRFLYRKMNAHRTMDECFLWFPYSVNHKTAREVRGLASFLYPIELATNKYKCRVLDIAFWHASAVFSQSTSGGQQALTLNEQGPFTLVPKDLQPVQNNVKPDMQQVLAVDQYLDSIGVRSVTGSDKQPLGTTAPKLQEGPSRQTKADAEIQQRLRSRKEEALFVQRMSVLDKVFRETYRRVMRLVERIATRDETVAADYPEIVDFIDRCGQRGVTAEMLLESRGMFTVVTCRDLVLGSEGKVGALSEILGSFGGTIDEPGRKNAVRDIVHLRLGAQSADRYAPEVSRDNAPSDQSSFAQLENNCLRQGMQVVAGQDQMHWSHIPVHSRLLQEIVDMVAAPQDNTPELNEFNGSPEQSLSVAEQTLQNLKEDPRKVLGILSACSKHVQEHLAVGGRQVGMEAQAKRVEAMLRDLRPTVKALNLAVATQERVEQAQREQAERDRQKAIEEAAVEKARVAQIEADKKAQVDIYRADREHEVALRRLELEEQVQSARAGLEQGRASADEARRDAESAAKIDRERKMNDARVNAARAAERMNVLQDVTGFSQTSPADVASPSGEETEYRGM